MILEPRLRVFPLAFAVSKSIARVSIASIDAPASSFAAVVAASSYVSRDPDISIPSFDQRVVDDYSDPSVRPSVAADGLRIGPG